MTKRKLYKIIREKDDIITDQVDCIFEKTGKTRDESRDLACGYCW